MANDSANVLCCPWQRVVNKKLLEYASKSRDDDFFNDITIVTEIKRPSVDFPWLIN